MTKVIVFLAILVIVPAMMYFLYYSFAKIEEDRINTNRKMNWTPGSMPLEPPPFGHHWSYNVVTERWEAVRDNE